ncbi:MAG: dipeptidase [Anaerolineae bacterium]|nr:dipeptidase [Anaerolineae bacterium]
MNRSTPTPWLDLHHRAIVVDIHAHPALKSALFHKSLLRRDKAIQAFFWPFNVRTNFPALQTGGVDVLLSAIYAPEKRLIEDLPLIKLLRLIPWSFVRRTWKDLMEPPYATVTRHLLDDLEQRLAAYSQQAGETRGQRSVVLAHSGAELERILSQGADGPIAFVHTLEGGHCLEGATGTEPETIANLEQFFERGCAALTLVHFYPNALGMTVFPYPQYILPLLPRRRLDRLMDDIDLTRGLTPMGRSVVRRMIEMGMLIDISHCTPPARRDVYEIVGQSGANCLVMASHVGAHTLNPSPYNLEDWEIRWIANHGGVVGVILMNYWLAPYRTDLGLDCVARTIGQFAAAAGGSTEHIAIGSDFDGFTDPPDDLKDASELPRLTERLLTEHDSPSRRRYTNQDIENILGANALRMLREGWGKRTLL